MQSNLDVGSVNLTPTYAEMSARMRSKARSLRHTADCVGHDTPKGRAALADAAIFARIALDMDEKQREARAARDGFLTEYRKLRANKENASV